MQQEWQANQANEDYSDSYEGESGGSEAGRSDEGNLLFLFILLKILQ